MSTFKTSAEIMQTVCTIGGNKPKVAFVPAFILAFLAGAYIGFGGLLATKLGGSIPVEYWGTMTRIVFAMVFPLGLLCVVVAGADLFTGNCMYGPAAVMHKTASFGGMLKNWIISYIGNFVGSIFIAFFLGHLTGLFVSGAVGESAVALANMKCNLPWDVAFWRGIGCNWLVCLAIYLTLSSGDGVSKMLLLWPPIAGFVAIGFEHSIANMTLLTIAFFVPNTLFPASGYFYNLLVVTLGNMIGGICVALAYYFIARKRKG